MCDVAADVMASPADGRQRIRSRNIGPFAVDLFDNVALERPVVGPHRFRNPLQCSLGVPHIDELRNGLPVRTRFDHPQVSRRGIWL